MGTQKKLSYTNYQLTKFSAEPLGRNGNQDEQVGDDN
jgi:hypothetical protein